MSELPGQNGCGSGILQNPRMAGSGRNREWHGGDLHDCMPCRIFFWVSGKSVTGMLKTHTDIKGIFKILKKNFPGKFSWVSR